MEPFRRLHVGAAALGEGRLARNAFALRAVAAAEVAGGELRACVRHFIERGGVDVALRRSGSRDDGDEEEAAEGFVGCGSEGSRRRCMRGGRERGL